MGDSGPGNAAVIAAAVPGHQLAAAPGALGPADAAVPARYALLPANSVLMSCQHAAGYFHAAGRMLVESEADTLSMSNQKQKS